MSAFLLVVIGWTNPDSGWPGTWPHLPQPPVCTQVVRTPASNLHDQCKKRLGTKL
jgi:hypothetical protein